MADVFISYKRENQDAVQHIVRGLRGAGLSVWWDQDIAPDAPWEATIERELEKARVVLVAWSRAAVASENVKAEARRARTQGKLIQTFVEGCDPPLFFGERQGVDLTRWSGAAADNRFQAIVSAARAILAGRRPPQGVGYRPRKNNAWPLLTAAALAAAAAAVVLNVAGARDAACSVTALSGLCASQGAAAVDEQAPAQQSSAAAPQTTAAAQPVAATPRLAAGVEYRMEIPAGAAIDFDAGTVSDGIVDGSDLVLVEVGGGDFFLDYIAEPGGVRPDVNARLSQAMCPPGEYYYRVDLADVGEHNCFRTRDGREGGLVRLPDRRGFSGVVITYRFWE
jgi:hypothetical protein